MSFRPPDAALPILGEQEMGWDFDAGVYEFLYRKNYQEDNISLQLDPASARKTSDRCTKHVQRLQADLAKAGLLQTEGQNYTGENQKARMIAPFDLDEVKLGALLGAGGFSSVFAVKGFAPSSEREVSPIEAQAREFLTENALREIEVVEEDDLEEKSVGNKKPSRSGSKSHPLKERKTSNLQPQYAIKHLRRSLIPDPEKFERAAIDMALEAQLLLAMDHPNIVSLRGWSSKGVQGYLSGKNTDFFVIIDRLSETLDVRLVQWRNIHRKYRSRSKIPWGRQKFHTKLDSLVMDRLQTMHDVATALDYMHDRRILNRDLKAANIGFDMTGEVKLFDFGLSRLLPSRRSAMPDGYCMSRVGTKYYMAPEVRAKAPYNLSADVYSFGVVFWEVMALSTPRETLQKIRKDEDLVPSRRCMLPICKCWPSYMQIIIEKALSNNPANRPSISDIHQVLRLEMENLGMPKRPVDARRATFRVDLSDMEQSVTRSTACSTDFRTSNTTDVESLRSTPLLQATPVFADFSI
jgi:serine/threonine protein kinase